MGGWVARLPIPLPPPPPVTVSRGAACGSVALYCHRVPRWMARIPRLGGAVCLRMIGNTVPPPPPKSVTWGPSPGGYSGAGLPQGRLDQRWGGGWKQNSRPERIFVYPTPSLSGVGRERKTVTVITQFPPHLDLPPRDRYPPPPPSCCPLLPAPAACGALPTTACPPLLAALPAQSPDACAARGTAWLSLTPRGRAPFNKSAPTTGRR